MDTAMRDLDQLRERSDESTGRKVGLFALAGLLSVAAVFAMGLMLRGTEGESAEAPLDPLSELTRQAAPKPAEEPVPPEALSFPSTLLSREEAILEATIRAAEREHAALSERGGVGEGVRPSLSDLPAGSLATEDNQRLQRVAKLDPLIADALPTGARAAPAPAGHDGAFTLQVVSYEDRKEAHQFAHALRARGHKAYVTEAEVPDRGRFYRVRIGPFDTRREATAYQARFEETEHMHTILVSSRAR